MNPLPLDHIYLAKRLDRLRAKMLLLAIAIYNHVKILFTSILKYLFL